MSSNEERKNLKKYNRNFLKWIRYIGVRFKVPLFLLVFTLLILGIGLFINSLISRS